jgi:Protein of unknown function (DUF1592)/Protein of unknown function (DUF1588)/Protein of unknown function (DUF1587)/Protein of unknown function (DUF1595)/Protein of unknown function (DUF1585)
MVRARSGWAALPFIAACYTGIGGQGADDGADDADSDAGDASEGGDTGVSALCGEPGAVLPGRAPLRRLTRFEYNNTVLDLLGDDTLPANAFPSEELGNGFGNDADAQAVSSLLAEQYLGVAEDIAIRATETPAKLAVLSACAGEITAASDRASEDACARTLIAELLPRAFRRPVDDGEIDALVELQQAIRTDADFAVSIATAIEAILQSPDFLYRTEWGELDDAGRRRPTGHEMATRLSYFFWGTMPDDALFAAAEAGELVTADGVRAHAERLLDDPRSHHVVRFFFDNMLPISSLSALERDPLRYPSYTAQIGAYLREETQSFLEHVIFADSGSWPDALTAEYTFVNAALAEYYGIAGVEGETFQKVEIDTTQRLGLLTQAGMVAGTIHSNETNPVVRGSFVTQRLMCNIIPLPTGDVAAQVKPPDPDSGATARERYSQHSSDPVCAGCHRFMDPVGLALENYDAVGLWRDSENGVTIDASGSVPGTEGTVNGPIELVRKIAEAPETHACFARHWADFAYGRTLGTDDEDTCVRDAVTASFTESGYDIQELMLALTQTDAFLYLPEEHG